jgi:hypothetical protein
MRTTVMAASYKNPPSADAGVRSAPVGAALRQAFAFRGDVQALTDDSPQLLPLLLEARQHVERVFGSDVPTVLEVVQNPEAADASPELFAYIQTTLPVPEAREKLEKLDDEWWLDALPRAEGRLNIALEYV